MFEDDGLLDRLAQDRPWMWLVLALVFAAFAWVETGIVRFIDLALLALCLGFAVLSYKKRQ